MGYGTQNVWRNFRPLLTVVSTGGRSLGRCYASQTYRITSLHRLNRKNIEALREAGFLGIGQEFIVKSTCDGTEDPAGYDVIPCIEVDMHTNEPTGKIARNTFGDKIEPIEGEYFVYDVESRVDSGD